MRTISRINQFKRDYKRAVRGKHRAILDELLIAQQNKVRSLPITDIENLAEALLDFKGMDDLEIWLRENVV
ncbi:MAG: hypothetical protein DCF20_05480 [Pseudanabaena sp.]|nr:MAG: hypothetical protein DCF20_05480 [Pseudanabaena sp.]